ncbi:hypothetical protein MTR67_034572 [Solanum verrucosum]|uniref:Uncharacterized protein n=1 Tax=Solanum verrucosum TaxID=315347 RepID=A0AAF0U8F4_SOLVR|nr:hypothetical protein MTR67_034572 [Solanum verrucosum]
MHLANKEMEEKSKTMSSFSEPSSPSQTRVSMKKSLQRFLQKRKKKWKASNFSISSLAITYM